MRRSRARKIGSVLNGTVREQAARLASLLVDEQGDRRLGARGEDAMAAGCEAAAGERLAGMRRRARNRLTQRAGAADVREAREQPLGVRVLGRLEHLAHRALLDDLA